MIDHFMTTSPGSAPGVGLPTPPNYHEYQHLKYWFEVAWQALRSKHGTKELPIDALIISAFMEDEFGDPISEAIKARLRGDLMAYWTDIHNTGEKLKNWTDIGLERKDHFQNTFETKYPWLHLCEASWKVDHLWINHFRTWKKSHPELATTPEKPNVPKKIVVIESTDSDSTGDSIGIKRRREDQEEDASKRHKGKGKEVQVVPSNKFHPPRPLPKGKPLAKVAKVSSSLRLFITYLLKTLQDILYSDLALS